MLVKWIAPFITKKTTIMRQPIDPEVKIAITLRFLATGESYESLMYQFWVHSSTISKFISVVCNNIYETFKGRFLQLRDTTEEWEIIEHETCGNFVTLLDLPTGSILRLFILLIVDQNFTTVKGFSQSFYLRQLITIINSSLLM